MSFTPIEEEQLLEHLVNFNNPHGTTMTKSGLQTTDDLPEGLVNLYSQVGGLIYLEGAAPYLDIINLPDPKDGELWVSTTDDSGAGVTSGDGILYNEETDLWTNIGPLQGPQGIQGERGEQGDPGKPIHHTRLVRSSDEYDYYGLWLDALENEFIGEYAVRQSLASGPPGSSATININPSLNLEGGGTFQLNQPDDETLNISHTQINPNSTIDFSVGVSVKTIHLDNGHIESIDLQSFDSRYYMKGGDRLTGPMDVGGQYIFNLATNLNDSSGAVNLATLQNFINSHSHTISDIPGLQDSLASKMPKTGGTFQGPVHFGNNILSDFSVPLPNEFGDADKQRWPVAIMSVRGILGEYLLRDGTLGMEGNLDMSSIDEHGTTNHYYIHQMEQPLDIFDSNSQDWAASIGLVSNEFVKYLKHNGDTPFSGDLNANNHKINNINVSFDDDLTCSATVGMVKNHNHTMDQVDGLLPEFDKYTTTENHLSTPSGSDDTGKLIKLDTGGKINPGFLSINAFHYAGSWDPSGVDGEYPIDPGKDVGWFWNVVLPDGTNEYEFVEDGGSLEGEITTEGDVMILKEVGPPEEWVLRESSVDPDVYLPKSGGTMTGNISMGNTHNILDLAPIDALNPPPPSSASRRDSVVLLDGSQIMTGDLKIRSNSPKIYFEGTGTNPNTWGYGILEGVCTIHIKLSDSSTEAKFSIQDNAKFLELKTDGIFYDSNRILTTADEGSGNGLDAGTLETHPASYFLNETTGDARYLQKIGGTLTGNLHINKYNVIIQTSYKDSGETDAWVKGFEFTASDSTLYGGFGSFGTGATHNYQFWGITDEPWLNGLRLYDDNTFFLNDYEIYHSGNLDLSGYAPINHDHDSVYVNITGDSMTGELSVVGRTNNTGIFLQLAHAYLDDPTINIASYKIKDYNGLDLCSLGMDSSGNGVVLDSHSKNIYLKGATFINTNEVWHEGNFDPSDKSNTNHNHDSTYLKLSGGTLSGNINISTDSTKLSLNTTANTHTYIAFRNNNITHFELGSKESSNDGFVISRFDASGNYVDTPFKIGFSDIGSIPTLSGEKGVWVVHGDFKASDSITSHAPTPRFRLLETDSSLSTMFDFLSDAGHLHIQLKNSIDDSYICTPLIIEGNIGTIPSLRGSINGWTINSSKIWTDDYHPGGSGGWVPEETTYLDLGRNLSADASISVNLFSSTSASPTFSIVRGSGLHGALNFYQSGGGNFNINSGGYFLYNNSRVWTDSYHPGGGDGGDADTLDGLDSTEFARLDYINAFTNMCSRLTPDEINGFVTWDASYDGLNLYIGYAFQDRWRPVISSVAGNPGEATPEDLFFVSSLLPFVGSAFDLGSPTNTWFDIFLTNPPYTLSDVQRLENISSIQTMDADLLLSLTPKFFDIIPKGITNNPFLKDTDSSETAKTRMGFIAQEVESAMRSNGFDPELYALTKGRDGEKFLNSTDLIPLLVKKIQDLENRLITIETSN